MAKRRRGKREEESNLTKKKKKKRFCLAFFPRMNFSSGCMVSASIVDDGHPLDLTRQHSNRKHYRRVEERVMIYCSLYVFTSPPPVSHIGIYNWFFRKENRCSKHEVLETTISAHVEPPSI